MEKRKDVEGYILCHKKLDYGVWDNALYTPLEVGAHYHEEPVAELRDNTGDNISATNPYFLELTGMYWIWKNHRKDTKYILQCQYRRRFEFPEDFNFDTIFTDHDAIACTPLRMPSVRLQYCVCHSYTDMQVLEKVVKDLYPEYSDDFDEYITYGTKLYYSNGLIMRTEAFDKYCEWLFSILWRFVEARGWYSLDDVRRTVKEEIDEGVRRGTKGVDYQMEICAFISERLMTLYLRRNCRVYEMPYKKYEGILI